MYINRCRKTHNLKILRRNISERRFMEYRTYVRVNGAIVSLYSCRKMELDILFMYVYSSFTTLVSSSKLSNRRNSFCILGDHNLSPVAKCHPAA
jgi:hypothetical protein